MLNQGGKFSLLIKLFWTFQPIKVIYVINFNYSFTCCTVGGISETLNTYGPVFAFRAIAFNVIFTFIMIFKGLKKMNSWGFMQKSVKNFFNAGIIPEESIDSKDSTYVI